MVDEATLPVQILVLGVPVAVLLPLLWLARQLPPFEAFEERT
jgi:hypothetical protein